MSTGRAKYKTGSRNPMAMKAAARRRSGGSFRIDLGYWRASPLAPNGMSRETFYLIAEFDLTDFTPPDDAAVSATMYFCETDESEAEVRAALRDGDLDRAKRAASSSKAILMMGLAFR